MKFQVNVDLPLFEEGFFTIFLFFNYISSAIVLRKINYYILDNICLSFKSHFLLIYFSSLFFHFIWLHFLNSVLVTAYIFNSIQSPLWRLSCNFSFYKVFNLIAIDSYFLKSFIALSSLFQPSYLFIELFYFREVTFSLILLISWNWFKFICLDGIRLKVCISHLPSVLIFSFFCWFPYLA